MKKSWASVGVQVIGGKQTPKQYSEKVTIVTISIK